MNVKVSLLTLTLAAALSVSPVFAEEMNSTVTGRPQNRNEYLKEKELTIEGRVTKAAERKSVMEANVTERMEKRQEKRNEIAQKHAENLELQFNNHFTRLMTLASKIQTRIDALNADGKDTTAAQAKLDAGKTSLESAKSLGTDAVSAFLAIDTTTTEEHKTQVDAAKAKAMKAREAYISSMKLLKEAIVAVASLQGVK